MSKYLLYKPNKNCAETPNGYHNIAVSLGGLFYWRTLYVQYTGCAKKDPLAKLLYYDKR